MLGLKGESARSVSKSGWVKGFPPGVVDTLFICPAQIFFYSLYHGCKCWCAGPTSQKTVEATAGGERATGSRPGLASFPSPSLGTTGKPKFSANVMSAGSRYR